MGSYPHNGQHDRKSPYGRKQDFKRPYESKPLVKPAPTQEVKAQEIIPEEYEFDFDQIKAKLQSYVKLGKAKTHFLHFVSHSSFEWSDLVTVFGYVLAFGIIHITSDFNKSFLWILLLAWLVLCVVTGIRLRFDKRHTVFTTIAMIGTVIAFFAQLMTSKIVDISELSQYTMVDVILRHYVVQPFVPYTAYIGMAIQILLIVILEPAISLISEHLAIMALLNITNEKGDDKWIRLHEVNEQMVPLFVRMSAFCHLLDHEYCSYINQVVPIHKNYLWFLHAQIVALKKQNGTVTWGQLIVNYQSDLKVLEEDLASKNQSGEKLIAVVGTTQHVSTAVKPTVVAKAPNTLENERKVDPKSQPVKVMEAPKSTVTTPLRAESNIVKSDAKTTQTMAAVPPVQPVVKPKEVPVQPREEAVTASIMVEAKPAVEAKVEVSLEPKPEPLKLPAAPMIVSSQDLTVDNDLLDENGLAYLYKRGDEDAAYRGSLGNLKGRVSPQMAGSSHMDFIRISLIPFAEENELSQAELRELVIRASHSLPRNDNSIQFENAEELHEFLKDALVPA